jgi:hypothetical protein
VQSSRYGEMEEVVAALGLGVDVNSTDDNGRTGALNVTRPG